MLMVTRFIDSDRLTALASEESRSQEPYPWLNERLLRPEGFDELCREKCRIPAAWHDRASRPPHRQNHPKRNRNFHLTTAAIDEDRLSDRVMVGEKRRLKPLFARISMTFNF